MKLMTKELGKEFEKYLIGSQGMMATYSFIEMVNLEKKGELNNEL